MRIRLWLLALVLSVSASATVPESQAKVENVTERFARISKTISPVLFDTPRSKVKIPLRAFSRSICKAEGFCSYRDKNGVEYLFVDNGLTALDLDVIKWGSKPLTALGLGTLRDKIAVMKAVRAFMGNAEFDCDDMSLTEVDRSCKTLIGDGWLRLEFTPEGKLQHIQVVAWEWT
jgi:hypothetical protein